MLDYDLTRLDDSLILFYHYYLGGAIYLLMEKGEYSPPGSFLPSRHCNMLFWFCSRVTARRHGTVVPISWIRLSSKALIKKILF